MEEFPPSERLHDNATDNDNPKVTFPPSFFGGLGACPQRKVLKWFFSRLFVL